ncbi:MAG: hypothetical protein CL549_06585 [Alcanivorax sp.]|nr:hypothetical protein [Alcanivorax sp.]MAY10147.1 hypothetical protein [Alcanivorax sp.]
MRIEQRATHEWAGRLTKVVVARTKRRLRSLFDGATLSGEGSGLLNVWDEICVQERGGRSFYWSAYEYQIEQYLYDEVARLGEPARLALWAQTPDGWDWVYDHHGDKDGETTAPLDLGAVLGYLKHGVLAKAEREKNSRVDEYLYGPGQP